MKIFASGRIKWIPFYLLLFFTGCLSQIASVEESAPKWIGRPIADLQKIMARSGSYASRIGWKETTHKLKNGNIDYVEPIRPGCYIHWEVDSHGLIIGYRTKGNHCY